MIILIAESKTMLTSEKDVSREEFTTHTPLYEKTASEIMNSLKNLSAGEMAAALRLSASLTSKMQKMVYEFDFKEAGNRAIDAFTGVVFRALDYKSLEDAARQRCDNEVRIISSLYGWLRPDDIVKPYRLDFTTRLEDGPSAGKAMNTFWRMNATKALVRTLQNENATEILNLLPADAAKCIDWKLVKRFAKVWKVDFQEIRDGGMMKTPTAEKLKSLRGKLLRQMLTEDIRDTQSLIHVSSDDYVCDGTPQYPDHLHFLC